MPPEESQPTQAPDGPLASPMTSPNDHEGEKAQGRIKLQLALKIVESSLMDFGGVATPEGKKIISLANSLAKLSGESGGPDLNQAEVKMLAAKAGPENAGPGGPPPAGPGGPGGMPGGMPMAGPMPRPM